MDPVLPVTLTYPPQRGRDPRPGLVGRLSRCMGVSAVTTSISVVIIFTCTALFGVAAAVANVIATSVATVPSYHLNRRWTWGRRDRSDLFREVVPFWVLAFCGLALSTLTVAYTDSWASRLRLTPTTRSIADVFGHLAGFGLLWIVQFVLLDRALFKSHGAPIDAPQPVRMEP